MNNNTVQLLLAYLIKQGGFVRSTTRAGDNQFFAIFDTGSFAKKNGGYEEFAVECTEKELVRARVLYEDYVAR